MSVVPQVGIPGAGLDPARMPGHWLLARLGKRVLRPGGVELTRWLLDTLQVGPGDQVVELAAGLGSTARLAVDRRPVSYTGVDRDAVAAAAVSALAASQPVQVRGHHAYAARTGLPDACATVVYAEAMLTMQPEPAKRRVVAEARRLLAAGGRYGMRAPMHLLEPRRLVADEGWAGAVRIAARAARDPVARRRVRHVRRVFRCHSAHVGAIAIVAEAPSPTRQEEPS